MIRIKSLLVGHQTSKDEYVQYCITAKKIKPAWDADFRARIKFPWEGCRPFPANSLRRFQRKDNAFYLINNTLSSKFLRVYRATAWRPVHSPMQPVGAGATKHSHSRIANGLSPTEQWRHRTDTTITQFFPNSRPLLGKIVEILPREPGLIQMDGTFEKSAK